MPRRRSKIQDNLEGVLQMGIAHLINQWEQSASGQITAREYQVRLAARDAARVAALAEMYPRRTEEELISEMLTAALDDLERVMPYVPGNRVVSEDEEGNPIYEDVGPTPRFQALYRKYMELLR
jgi:hypothetical protein